MNTKTAPARGAPSCYCLDGRTATAHFPGVGRYVTNLGHALAPLLGENERLCILRDPGRPQLFEAFADLPDKVAVMDLPISPFSPRQQWHIPALLRDLGAAVYHSPYTLLPYATRVPTLVTVHDIIPMLFPGESTRKARLFFAAALRLALRKARGVVFVSQHTRRDLEQRFGSIQGRVVPEAAAPHFRPAGPQAVCELRQRLGLPRAYALYLGSTKPHKNLRRLVRLWQGQDMPWPLVVAGVRAEHAAALPETQRITGRVHMAGRIQDADLPALYSGAELFVFPSLYEGFGLPVLEAMACGAPVLCSDRASLPEVGGEAAAYIDPEDEAAMARQVHALAASPQRLARMRAQSQEQAARFSWRRTAELTLDYYRDLARQAV